METPSSTSRFTNTIPLSRKIEDSEKILSKSKGQQQQQQDRCALMDMTNDSPIVGLANGGNLETPSEKQRVRCVKNTPGSGEALLRGQVKTLMQKVEEEALEFLAPNSQIQSLSDNVDNGLSSNKNQSVVFHQESISKVVNMNQESYQEKCEITKLLDFSEKPHVSDESEECNSEMSYQEVTQGSVVGSCSITDDASSIWSMQVNASNNDEDDIDEEFDEEDEDEENYYDVEEEEEEYEGLDELCEGLNNVRVNEKVVPKFAGKHTRFVYNSDDEIVKEEEDESVNNADVLCLKGLPTPKGKHLRFSEEEEEGKSDL